MKLFYILIALGLVVATPGWALEPVETCSSFNAVYKPHDSYENSERQNFELTISELSQRDGVRLRGMFKFTAFSSDTGEKLSEMNLALTDSANSAATYLDSYYGQYAISDELKDFDYSSRVNFEPIALNKDFSQAKSILSDNAPLVLIFPRTSDELYRDGKRNITDWDKYIKFFSSEKVFPAFYGMDVWVLSKCEK